MAYVPYKIRVCQWLGDSEGCRQPTILGKSYCETHYNRVYTTLFTQMADYIIDKELHANKSLAQYKQK